MTYVVVDGATGNATLENQTDHRRYACRLSFDESSDSYDCKSGPPVGAVVKMVAQGLKSQFCTGAGFGGFGVAAADADAATAIPRCDYDCDAP